MNVAEEWIITSPEDVERLLDGWTIPTGQVVLVRGLFDVDVDQTLLEQLWDRMWQCSQHTFVVASIDGERARTWASKHAIYRHFGWGACEPIRYEDSIHLDDLHNRNTCGWAYQEGDEDGPGFPCHHPKQEQPSDEEQCFAFSCPIATEACTRAELRAIGLEDQYDYSGDPENPDDNDEAHDTDWMILHSRPRDAFAENVKLAVISAHTSALEE